MLPSWPPCLHATRTSLYLQSKAARQQAAVLAAGALYLYPVPWPLPVARCLPASCVTSWPNAHGGLQPREEGLGVRTTWVAAGGGGGEMKCILVFSKSVVALLAAW
jgi:hypothetical protein